MSVKFSIITPSFNGVKYFPHIIGSIKGQKGIIKEHIIEDGGSTDKSLEYIDNLKKHLSDSSNNMYEIKFTSEKDEGMYDAINKGWSKASGDILSWLNCDEQYLPGTLEYVQNIFEKFPDVDVVYGNAIVVDGNGELIAARKELPLNYFMVSNTFLHIFSCTIFYRKKLWDSGILKLNSKYKNAGDMDLILRLMKNNIKMFQSDRFFSLFAADGNNLSHDPLLKIETKSLQKEFSQLYSFLRPFVLLLRRLMRLINGHYKNVEISYEYALNDNPDYKSIKGSSRGIFKL